MRENVSNSLVMIQPSMLSYSAETDEATPVLMEIDSMKKDVILLLDCFFYVCIWKGSTVIQWEKAGYQNDSSYWSFKSQLESPMEDAKYIMQDRFPMPRFYIT